MGERGGVLTPTRLAEIRAKHEDVRRVWEHKNGCSIDDEVPLGGTGRERCIGDRWGSVDELLDEVARLDEHRAPRCYLEGCDNLATCVGRYGGLGPVLTVCDDHCRHGNEDGWCEPIAELPAVVSRYSVWLEAAEKRATEAEACLTTEQSSVPLYCRGCGGRADG